MSRVLSLNILAKIFQKLHFFTHSCMLCVEYGHPQDLALAALDEMHEPL